MKSINNASLKIDESNGRGRGVFALKSFKEGEIIELAPVMVFENEEQDLLHSTKMGHYTYQWGENGDEAAIAFGFGSFYNHSYLPNAEYYPDMENNIMAFIAIRKIEIGDEITINYNGDYDDLTPMIFDVLEN